MADTDFSARAPALGYLYQIRYALYLLLSSEKEETELALEQLDDVVFEVDGTATELLQLKHHIDSQASLTSLSPDLWKTLRIWSEYIAKKRVSDDIILTLVTTATAPETETSITKHLRPRTGRDSKRIADDLLKLANTSTNKELTQSFTAYKNLTEAQREALVDAIQVLDGSSDIIDTSEKIKQRLQVRLEHREAVYARLEGWWFDRVVRHLKTHKTHTISKIELIDHIVDINEQFLPDALPIDFLHSEPPEPPDPETDQRR